MADEQAQDRVFEPTPQRINQFREEGRVALSRDLMSTAQLAVALVAFLGLGGTMYLGVCAATRWVLEHAADSQITMTDAVVVILDATALPMLGIGVFATVGAVGTGLAQTRLNWAPKSLGFKGNRINPISRFPQIFSPKKLGMNVLLSAVKITFAGLVMTLLLAGTLTGFASLGLTDLASAQTFVKLRLFELLMGTTGVLAVVSVLDYIWQYRQVHEQMKMTREEYRRDLEEQEGKPMVRAKRKAMHRELTLNRIIERVPEADVIVTNPTHYAVALRYRPGEDHAPMVTAKGADDLAAMMRTLARRHGVPIVENRPLARSLFAKVKVGRSVPTSLYQAVAEILARVWRARMARGERMPGQS